MIILIFGGVFLSVRQIFNDFKIIVVVKNLWQRQLPNPNVRNTSLQTTSQNALQLKLLKALVDVFVHS